MNHLVHARETVLHLIDLLKTSGGLLIDARVVEPAPEVNSRTIPEIAVVITGPDAELFLCNEAELLNAVHHIASAALSLEQEDLDRLWFDIDNVKADRMAELRSLAAAATDRVHATSEEYAFAPMPGCERHMLHRALEDSGLEFASVGTGAGRRVVVYPGSLPLESQTSRESDCQIQT